MTKYAVDDNGTFEVPDDFPIDEWNRARRSREMGIQLLVDAGLTRELAIKYYSGPGADHKAFGPYLAQQLGTNSLYPSSMNELRAYVQTQRDRLHLRYAITLADQTEDGEDYTRNFIDADEVDTVLANILRMMEES